MILNRIIMTLFVYIRLFINHDDYISIMSLCLKHRVIRVIYKPCGNTGLVSFLAGCRGRQPLHICRDIASQFDMFLAIFIKAYIVNVVGDGAPTSRLILTTAQ